MRPLREDERDEIEAVKHFVNYVNSNKKAHPFEIYEAFMKLGIIGQKYVESQIVTEDELNELMEADDLKEVLQNLCTVLKKHIQDGSLDTQI